MVQHLLHIQNLVTPEICYNTRRFRRSASPLGASGSGFGIFQPPPVHDAEREQLLCEAVECKRATGLWKCVELLPKNELSSWRFFIFSGVKIVDSLQTRVSGWWFETSQTS